VRGVGPTQLASGVGACGDGARPLGKSDGILCEGPEVKYAFIERHRRLWPICVQCPVLGVNVPGFHQHRTQRGKNAGRRHLTGEALMAHVLIIESSQIIIDRPTGSPLDADSHA